MNNIPANEAKISAQAVAAFASTPNPRLRQVVQGLVRHLHAFASEVELTEEEWLEGIRFLTDTGRMCDGAVRQEFILLSDVIGLSMLVDAINHRATETATETTVFGPFYIAGMPERSHGENMAFTPGDQALVVGRVLDAGGEPIANAVLDVWQTAENGMYSGQDPEQPPTNLRGRYRTDATGHFAIRTIMPVSYPIPTDGPVGRLLQASDRHPWRPAHLHFMVMAPGHRTLVTHLFNHDDPYLDSDVVFGVKDSLKVVYQPCQANHALASVHDINGTFRLASYDFVLERETP
ncbi:dioxygenase [Pseudomonas sp. LFM046]|uniref:dioxygenase family protein n=1 Tax=Pseudomonas sp. LFM046 TaxID=1608357 RepID=UPI0005CFD2EB|nr:dioxygenase [Pseudomonas sp. LFM046]